MKQGTDFDNQLRMAGVISEFILVEGAEHSFDLRPEQEDLRPVVGAFFDKHLGVPVASE